MSILEALFIALISGAIGLIYQQIHSLDHRLDRIELSLEKLKKIFSLDKSSFID